MSGYLNLFCIHLFIAKSLIFHSLMLISASLSERSYVAEEVDGALLKGNQNATLQVFQKMHWYERRRPAVGSSTCSARRKCKIVINSIYILQCCNYFRRMVKFWRGSCTHWLYTCTRHEWRRSGSSWPRRWTTKSSCTNCWLPSATAATTARKPCAPPWPPGSTLSCVKETRFCARKWRRRDSWCKLEVRSKLNEKKGRKLNVFVF